MRIRYLVMTMEVSANNLLNFCIGMPASYTFTGKKLFNNPNPNISNNAGISLNSPQIIPSQPMSGMGAPSGVYQQQDQLDYQMESQYQQYV